MRDITKADLLKAARIVRGNSFNYTEIIRNKKSKYNLGIIYEFRTEAENFKYDLLDASSLLHGVDTTTLIDDDEFNTFIYKSRLLSGKNEVGLLSSPIYKGRLICGILKLTYFNIPSICNSLVGDPDNFDMKIKIITQMRNCIADFIENYANDKDFNEQIMKLNEMFVVVDSRRIGCSSDVVDNRMKLVKELKVLERMLTTNLINTKPDDYIIIQNIVLSGFIATTIGNHKHTLIVKEDVSYRNKESIKEVVTSLGKCITRVTEFRGEDAQTSLYQLFLEAKPALRFKWNISESDNLKAGCQALAYLYFITDSKKIKKAIRDMIY